MNISTRLRELLSLHGVTQVELAHALNVATSYINAVVNGKKKLPLDSLECICSYLGISMAEFFQPFSDQPPLPKHIETFRAATADLQEDEVPPLLAMVVWMRNHRISQRSSPQAAHYQAIVGEAAAGLPVYSPGDYVAGKAVKLTPLHLLMGRMLPSSFVHVLRRCSFLVCAAFSPPCA